MTQNKIKNLLIGKFKVESHPHFVLVDKKYHNKSEMSLQKQTLDSFIKMREAAEKDGIHLTIVSGTRNFNTQKSIWERKYKENNEEGFSDIENIKKIMLWSSMPSTSRHHWGTDIDINGFDDYLLKVLDKMYDLQNYRLGQFGKNFYGYLEVKAQLGH